MIVICIIQVAISGLAIISMKKSVRKWIIAFNVWWLFLLILNTIIPYGNYKLSENACICFGLFLFFTSVGYIFVKPVKNSIIVKNNDIYIDKQYEILIAKNKVINVIVIILTIVLFYYAIKYTAYMSNNSILNARLARFYVGHVFSSTFELLFFNYIVAAGRFLFVFIISFGLIYGQLKNIPFVFSIIGIVLYSYIGGSRFPIVLLAVSFIVLFVIKKEKEKSRLTGKNVLRFILFIIVAIAVYFVMLYFTAYRLGMKGFDKLFLISSTSVLYDQIVGYNIGPLSSFSRMLDSGMLYNHYYFGRGVLLNGLDEFFTNILSAFGIHISSARYAIGEIAAQTISVGNRSFNALYTCVYWFFSDLGYFGVILYSLIFGAVEKKIVTNYYKKLNLWSLMLVVHCIYFLIMSNITWEINSMDSLIYIAFICFYIRWRNKKIII